MAFLDLEVFVESTKPSVTIVVSSGVNHDAEALAVTLEDPERRGYSMIVAIIKRHY